MKRFLLIIALILAHALKFNTEIKMILDIVTTSTQLCDNSNLGTKENLLKVLIF